MPSPTVTIFNTSPSGLSVSVNNGAFFTIGGVSNSSWSPQTPSWGGPSWSNGPPGPNTLAPGPNALMITPAGSPTPFVTTVVLPKNLQWDSLQLFIFFDSYGNVSWMVLNGGQFVTGNIQLGSS